MSCENPRQTFVMGTPPTYGSPNPRYIRPVVRINAMVQDAPVGYVVNPCFLPMEEIAEATNQTLSMVGGTISLSGNGGSITLPTGFDQQTLSLNGATLAISNGNEVTLPVLAMGTEPPVVSDAAIPTDIIGEDTYLLGKPPAYVQVTIAGAVYNLPAYANNINIGM